MNMITGCLRDVTVFFVDSPCVYLLTFILGNDCQEFGNNCLVTGIQPTFCHLGATACRTNTGDGVHRQNKLPFDSLLIRLDWKKHNFQATPSKY